MITVNFSPQVDTAKMAGILQELKADPMGGWIELPKKVNAEEIARIKAAAKKINEDSEYLVCIGIGGSYLGHRAVVEALRPDSGLKIIYAGKSLSRRELEYTLNKVGDKDFSINVISKSGATLEPSIAKGRIYATTDAVQGSLHDEAVNNGYTMFVVPDNIGGRYSVLTAVGLLPMAVAGVNIDELLAGALAATADAVEPAIRYAWMRYTLAMNKYDTEVFASFEPFTEFFNEWLKQLFGESEGKNGQGIWPASVVYSTDLHSLGQFMQEGRRNLWETIIDYPTDEMNKKVVHAVMKAHTSGGIPVLSIGVSSYDAKGFGELIYFFELACAMSAKLLGVNPFDQPGVEAYKNELKKLI